MTIAIPILHFWRALSLRGSEGGAAEMRDSDWYRENSPDRAARMSDAMEDNNPANFLQAADPYEGG